jgi:hypothetical protein
MAFPPPETNGRRQKHVMADTLSLLAAYGIEVDPVEILVHLVTKEFEDCVNNGSGAINKVTPEVTSIVVGFLRQEWLEHLMCFECRCSHGEFVYNRNTGLVYRKEECEENSGKWIDQVTGELKPRQVKL